MGRTDLPWSTEFLAESLSTHSQSSDSASKIALPVCIFDTRFWLSLQLEFRIDESRKHSCPRRLN